MAQEHVVVQGEHLARIARTYGFTHYEPIWNHGQNAELKQKRKSPHVLLPGDRLYIPDKTAKAESRATEQKHGFVLKKSKLKLRLVLRDLSGAPIAGASGELDVERTRVPFTTDAGGRVDVSIQPTDETAFLQFHESQALRDGILIPIKIGHLDPVTEESGQRTRLNNLGYAAGLPGRDGEQELAEQLHSAIEEFQCDHGLAVDGIVGPKTRAKLEDVHGM